MTEPNYGFSNQGPPGAPMGVPGAGMPQPQPQGNGMAVAGLVLGILTVVLCWLTWPAWILGILGIIFSAIGISRGSKYERGKGLATVGLVCSILGLVLSIIWTIYLVFMLSHARW